MELMLVSGRDTHLISPTDAQFRKQDIFESLKNQDVIYYMHRLTICDSRWYSQQSSETYFEAGVPKWKWANDYQQRPLPIITIEGK